MLTKNILFSFKKTIHSIAKKQINTHHVKANKNKKHISNKCIHHKQPLVIPTKKQIKKHIVLFISLYIIIYKPLLPTIAHNILR